MAIGERIHFFRIMRGMTQKYLGMLVGFPEKSADVRLAQYETGSRKPKADLTAALAQALDVAPQALDIPDIDSYIGLMHTLFALEDIYGLTVSKADGEVCLRIKQKTRTKPQKNYCKCLPLGRNKPQSSPLTKSAKRNTTSGGTITRSLTLRSIGRKPPLRN